MPQKSSPKTPIWVLEALELAKLWLSVYIPACKLPSVSLALMHDENLLWANAWGHANLATQEAATPQHLYRFASHSKTLTAIAVARLVEEGTLRLDEPLQNYLPWLKSNKAYATLTLRHLLSHASGTSRDTDDSGHWHFSKPFAPHAELKAYFKKAQPVIEPNTRMKYSNYGIALVGLVLEEVTGKPYADVMHTHVIKPLGLTRTFPDNPPAKSKLSIGYTGREDGQRYPLNPYLSAAALASATGFTSTPTEMARIFQAFIAGKNLVKRATQTEFTRLHVSAHVEGDPTSTYGLGVQQRKSQGHTVIGHSGGYPGFVTRTLVVPELGLTLSVAVNGLDADTWSILNGLISLFSFCQKRGKAPTTLKKYEGLYYNWWGPSLILAGPKHLYVGSAAAASPLSGAGHLIPVNLKQHAFRSENVDAYASYGQILKFKEQKGHIVALQSSPKSRAAYLANLNKIASGAPISA